MSDASPPAGSAQARAQDLLARGQAAEAEALLRQALAAGPEQPDLIVLLGEALGRQGRLPEALALVDAALPRFPRSAGLHFTRGFCRSAMGQLEAGRADLAEAVRLQPDFQNLLALAMAEVALKRHAEAADTVARALALRPDDPRLLKLQADIRLARGDAAGAAEAYQAAVAHMPQLAEAHLGLGEALEQLSRHEEAAAAYRIAIRLHPANAAAHFGLSQSLKNCGQLEDALRSNREAIRLQPQAWHYHSPLLGLLQYLPGLDAEALFREHRAYGAGLEQAPPLPPRPPTVRPRLRIGYLSSDFRHHVVSLFLTGLFANHDRGRFEVFAYSDTAKQDDRTAVIRGWVEHWRPVEAMSPAEAAAQIRDDEIDILVELGGHTGSGRGLAICAHRPAPVQVSWLGYPGTTGLARMDFRLTDAVADPPGRADALHTEKLVRLPGCFLNYGPPANAPAVRPPPSAGGRPVTFGSFNIAYKMTPAWIEGAAAVLARVPGSRLCLKSLNWEPGNPWMRRLAEAFARHGIARERLILLPKRPSFEEHLAEYHQVDIALDTFPYNGTTTTCEALWMGVPVVTLAGDRHAARVGASLLNHIGLADLVANTPEEYVEKAVALANDPAGLAGLRTSLRSRMAPLVDGPAFARKLEDACLRLWHEHLAAHGAAPPAADVAASWAEARRAMGAGRLNEAEPLLARLTALDPAHALAHAALAEVRHRQGRTPEALALLADACARMPAAAVLHAARGRVLADGGRMPEACAAMAQAAELDPSAGNLSDLATALRQAGRLPEALAAARRAREAAPADLDLAAQEAGLLFDQKDYAGALAACEALLARDPQRVEAMLGIARSLAKLQRIPEAVSWFERTLARAPDLAPERAQYGLLLMLCGRMADGVQAIAKAIESQPGRLDLRSELLMHSQYLPDLGAADLHALHVRHGAAIEAACRPLPQRPPTPHRKLRVGYVSADFKLHAVAFFVGTILAHHDPERVEVFAYYTDTLEDRVTGRLRGLVPNWRSLAGLDPRAAAERIRADEVDILVELGGHTGGGRNLPIFALKPAPVQATYLGYPGTTGMTRMDYRLSDAVADPVGAAEAQHTERIARLPGCFLCYDPSPAAPAVAAPPHARKGHVTFGNFNNAFKVTDDWLALAARLLARLPQARLVMKSATWEAGSDAARTRVQRKLQELGVDPGRVTLLQSTENFGKHLEQYAEVDIALDTFPYNGTTTTCEALWMGVPVVAFAGDRHAARVGASLLTHIGLADLVAHTPEEYIEKAAALARDPARLADLRATLRQRMAPLVDGAAFTRKLEQAYQNMWKTHLMKQFGLG